MDEGFTKTAYPKGPCLPYNTYSKDLSFGDLFFNDKPSKADNEKTTAETEAESLVSVTIQQDMSIIHPMTTPVIDLTSRPESPNVHRPLQATATETTTTTIHPPPPQPHQSNTDSMLKKRIDELEHIMANLIQDNKHLEERLDSHGARLYTLENLDIHQQVSKAMDEIVTNVVDWAIQALLHNHFRDLPEANMKEILHQRMWETNSYKTHEDHMMRYEALEKSMNCDHSEELLKDLAEASKKKKKRRDSPKMPPGSPPHQPPPPPTSSMSIWNFRITWSFWTITSAATTSSTSIHQPRRLMPFLSSTPEDLQMDDDMALVAQVHSSDDEDNGNAHIPKMPSINITISPVYASSESSGGGSGVAGVSSSSGFHQSYRKFTLGIWAFPLSSSSDECTCATRAISSSIWRSSGVEERNGMSLVSVVVQALYSAEAAYQMEECHKRLTDSPDDSIIRHNVSKPLLLGGPPDQMNVAYYLDVGLEQMVPDQMCIEEECKYDIAAVYGISHWWFQRQ
nr:hypothetical protein [Tanacetum cinerariifolium]